MTVLSGLMTTNVTAMERLYAVVGAGYSDIEVNSAAETDAGYRVVLGHQFHRQWHVEAGFYRLADINDVNQGSERNFSADAIYLGVNGKASNEVGELYYRLGVANVSLQYSSADSTGNCSAESNATSQNNCRYDSDTIAGIVGLGFDYSVAANTFVRFEAEYLRGKDGFDASIFSVGVRYDFN
ncbi:outer membrane beta-barrel protein [Alteromonas gilva]|uniref:Autotransporter outer membrane beta-barrel domain-containing protein n=1 Tax=Alteromonas gilva TaxID=2987522 RepID=A0ABT5L0A3_9ALTE|nr:outer membrane beta-barrel protein [Alteromonas gilva]MDC8830308.1 autotransporter outer membrane beta-barrel domain-containing protein [Alteromonas gilva]